jgi:hypothetical protein
MLPAAIGGSALLGFLGQKDANASAERIANTPQTTANVDNRQGSYVPHQMANPLYGYVGGIGQQMGQTPTPFFPGQGYVGPSGPTQQGVGMGMGALPYFQQAAGISQMGLPYYQQAANQAQAAQPTMNAGLGIAGNNYSFLSGAADIVNNPYVQGQLGANQSAVQDLLNKNLSRGAGNASRFGMLGSSADALMRGEAIGDAAEALSRTNASTMLGAYGQGLGAQQNALGQTGAMLNNLMAPARSSAWTAGLGATAARDAALGGAFTNQGARDVAFGGGLMGQGAQTALNLGQSVEGYQQQALQDAMLRFQHQYQEPWQRAGNVGQAMGLLQPLGTTYNNMAGTGNTAGPMLPTQSPLYGALGGASLGLGMADSLGLLGGGGGGSVYGASNPAHAASLGRTQYPF